MENTLLKMLQYKLGEYITGKDRSYHRSIYKAHKIIEETKDKTTSFFIEFEFISFMKRKRGKEEKREQYFSNTPYREARDYRLATEEELIEEGIMTQSMGFITHTN